MTREELIKAIREDYKEHKEEWNQMLDEGAQAKKDACTIKDKDGKVVGFDYLKMSKMYHSGKW